MSVVQIGIGGFGKHHCRVLNDLGVLQAVCDIDKERSDSFGKKYSVDNYYDIDKMIAEVEFEAAIIATPTITHFDIASKFIKHGKHVFVEKPMTYQSSEGEKLVQLAEDHDVLLTSGYIERFNPAVERVKEYVNQETYGELLMLEFHRENRMPLHIKDVGIIYDTSVHDIDTALWLFHNTPESVYARSGKIRQEHEDFASIMLGFPDNKVAIISSNWITPLRIRTFNAVFTEGRISGDFISQEVKIDTADGTKIPREEGHEPLYMELKNFTDAVRGEDELVVQPDHALNVTRIAEAALESAKTGERINLDVNSDI